MPLFILAETSAGYALLKSKDKKLLKRDDLAEETKTAEGACNLYALLDMQYSHDRTDTKTQHQAEAV